MRRRRVVLIAASAVLSLPACSSGNDDEVSPPAGFQRLQPQSFLLKLNADLRELKTLEFTGVTRQRGARVVIQGEMRYAEGDTDVRWEATSYLPDAYSPSAEKSVSTRIDGTYYLNYAPPGYRIPHGKKWLKITKKDVESLEPAYRVFPGDPTGILRALAVATDFRFVGTEERSGRTLARYAGSVDLEQAAAIVGDEYGGYADYFIEHDSSIVDFAISVDREGTLYHFELTNPEKDWDSELDIPAWAIPVNINPPEGHLVATLQDAQDRNRS